MHESWCAGSIVAQYIADTDPERAAQLVSNSLAEGVKPTVLNVLIDIHKKEPALADRLFAQVLKAARSDPSFLASPLSYLSLRGLGEYVFGLYMNTPGSNSGGAATVNTAAIIPYLEFIFDAAMKGAGQPQQDSNPQLVRLYTVQYNDLRKLLPYFNQYLPDKATAVAARMQYFAGYVPESSLKTMNDPMHLVEDMLEKARTSKSTQERDELFFQAAYRATANGDTDRAFSIAVEIKDEARRSQVESTIRYTASRNALTKGDVETAYRYARDVTELMMYGPLIKDILNALSGQKDKQKAAENKQRALDIIGEVERSLTRAEYGEYKTLAALRITEAAVPIDANRAFDLMQLAVKALNYTEAADPEAAKKGEMKPAALSVERVDFGRNLTPLAQADPDRALWLAQSLVRKDLKVLAQLAVCRGMLTKKVEPETAPAPPAKEDKKKATPIQKGEKDAPTAAPGKKKAD